MYLKRNIDFSDKNSGFFCKLRYSQEEENSNKMKEKNE